MQYDIDQIKDQNHIDQVVGQRIELTKNGREFIALCPFHSEKTPSFSVVPAKEMYFCFGCGEGGDVIDFIMRYDAVDLPTACQILGGEKKPPPSKDRVKREAKVIKSVYDGIEPIFPVPDSTTLISKGKKTPNIWNPKRDSFTTYKPSMVFEYKNKEGFLQGYVLRIDFDDKKITPMIMWCKLKDGSEGWCHYSFPEPRLPYGIDALYRNPDAPALIVEGEKSADAAHKLLPNYVVLTWSGGGKAVDKTNWSCLQDRKVTIWPDADQPGFEAGKALTEIARKEGAIDIKLIGWDKDKPKGWDAADALADGLKKADIISWAKERTIIIELSEPEIEEPPIEVYEETSEPSTHNGIDDAPFRILGYNKNIFYYLPQKTQQILELTPAQHTKNTLIVLAPHKYWLENFGSTSKNKDVDWDAAYEALINQCSRKGIFDGHEMVRGRGAWLDEGRPVLHLGTSINMDNETFRPQSVNSNYIYEANRDLNIPSVSPATNKEAHHLVEICEKLTWENDLSATLLAGWCVVAPVCGILKWRPHIWVTGQAGSGKTTVIKDIIQRVVGPMALNIEGKTTEAGIRQQLQQDARPIIFDEAESEDKHSAQRMQAVLDLARVASSGGRIMKGTVSGMGMSFSVRSCFCFASINTTVQHYADETRITKLVMKKDKSEGAEEKYKALQAKMFSIFTPEYSGKMLARSIKNLRTLQKNSETFVEAAARVFKSRRMADQIGPMLAGTYLCCATKEISLDEAVNWIEKHQWEDHTPISAKTDEERLLDRIATSRVRVSTLRGNQEATVGELIIICADGGEVGGIDKSDAERELKRIGIKVDKIEGEQWVLFANKSDPLKAILQDTPWAGEWSRPLKDVYHAEPENVTYFSPGIKARATRLPVAVFKE